MLLQLQSKLQLWCHCTMMKSGSQTGSLPASWQFCGSNQYSQCNCWSETGDLLMTTSSSKRFCSFDHSISSQRVGVLLSIWFCNWGPKSLKYLNQLLEIVYLLCRIWSLSMRSNSLRKRRYNCMTCYSPEMLFLTLVITVLSSTHSDLNAVSLVHIPVWLNDELFWQMAFPWLYAIFMLKFTHRLSHLIEGSYEIIRSKLSTFSDFQGCTPGQLALAWVMSQGDDVVPIPGRLLLQVA